ncbi:MAG TPA: cytochrome c [Pyrinomonadaceae bacterium]|nr:cytochrome c [Pyrinomonadaceae bacterium]
MRNNKARFIAVTAFAIPTALVLWFGGKPNVTANAAPEDAAAVYKAKCAMCHTPAATKFYDPARPEAEQVEAILNGKKGEKPPFMPAYKDKGIDEAGAKALVEYMKGLRSAT